jgi:hypothetical protein
MKFRIVVVAVLLGIPLSAYTQEPLHTYQPANFPADQSAIIRRIRFPRSEEDVFVRVFCDSPLDRHGRLEQNYCTSDYPKPDSYLFAVKRMSSSRLEPARVDGAKVRVWFQYTVQFERRDGIETIKLFPHHFVGVEGSGEEYSAPQRYRSPNQRWCQSFFDIETTLTIPAAGGKPTEIGIKQLSGDDTCVGFTLAIVEDSDFIPGIYQGVPIPASHRERWWRDLTTLKGLIDFTPSP